jgi:hypothetical protein
MANAWLARGVTISTVTNPGTNDAAGCKLWYKFDETTGTSVADSSGHTYTGDANSTPTYASAGYDTTKLWSSPGYDGTGACYNNSFSIIRDFNSSIEVNKSCLSTSQTSITVSIWVNGDIYMPLSGWPRLVFASQDFNSAAWDENEVLEIDCVARGGTANQVLFQAGMDRVGGVGAPVDSNSTSVSNLPLSAFAGGWQHWAFVRNGGTEVNSIRIYHNGEKVAEANALKPIFYGGPFPDGTGAVESFRICRAANDGSGQVYYGKIDDFRVYNRALTDAEVGWLGTKGSGNVPFANASNLKTGSSPERVNFGDMAILAKDWLTTKLWP